MVINHQDSMQTEIEINRFSLCDGMRDIYTKTNRNSERNLPVSEKIIKIKEDFIRNMERCVEVQTHLM